MTPTQAATSGVMPSFWDLIVSGGPLMWPLGLCSVIALAYAVERFVRLRAGVIGTEAFGARVVGMVVDAVSDVITLAPEQLRPVPELDVGPAAEHLLAIGTVDDRMLILVDIAKLLSGAEIGLAEATLQ